jgi:hypothetical protein
MGIYWLLLIAGAAGILVLGFICLMVVLCLFERMPIHQFERISDGPEPNDSEFAAPANAAAQSLGLICAGT